jgi:hypothetical protein
MLPRSRSASRRGAVELGAAEQRHELLSAEAEDGVAAAHAGGEAPGETPQHGVAELVAVPVVDPLEVVAVHHPQRQRTLMPVGELHLTGELQLQRPPIRNAGDRILKGGEHRPAVEQAIAQGWSTAHIDRSRRSISSAVNGRERLRTSSPRVGRPGSGDSSGDVGRDARAAALPPPRRAGSRGRDKAPASRARRGAARGGGRCRGCSRAPVRASAPPRRSPRRRPRIGSWPASRPAISVGAAPAPRKRRTPASLPPFTMPVLSSTHAILLPLPCGVGERAPGRRFAASGVGIPTPRTPLGGDSCPGSDAGRLPPGKARPPPAKGRRPGPGVASSPRPVGR